MTDKKRMLAYATGAVHPVAGGWHLDMTEITFTDGTWQLRVSQSRFHLSIDAPSRPHDELEALRNEIASVVQGCLDVICFHLATPMRVEVESIMIDGSTLVTSTSSWPAVLECPPVHPVPAETLNPFINAAVTEPLARFALADLRAALAGADDTAFFSYRAVESVKQYFVASGKEDAAWETMRTQLAVEKAPLMRLKTMADSRRHGSFGHSSAAERLEAIRIARDVVRRFITHLKWAA